MIKKRTLTFKIILILLIFAGLHGWLSALDVDVSIDTETENSPISPYIYGTNALLTSTENWTFQRLGGNRFSGFNWENNASNAGSDWEHSSDSYLCSLYNVPTGEYDTPGAVPITAHDLSLSYGMNTLISLQMAGYAAKDMDGTVSEAETAPSARWTEVVFEKGSSLLLNPDVNDAYTYMDEYVNFLVNTYGSAATSTGIKFYGLDCEPGLWSYTHPRIHPSAVTCTELRDKSINLAKVVKDLDPDAETIGGVFYGFYGAYSLQDAPDWDSVKGSYGWYFDYYLDQFRAASNEDGRRLLDIIDCHWYPEAQGGGERIVFGGTGSDDTCQARIQAPRTLWDSTYTETSWIAQSFPSYLPFLPRMQQSIDTYNPDTKLAITEWCYGGENHVSGGIATADVLGIFGKYGVYLASYWNIESTTDYTSAGFKIFRNYDGSNSTYGDTKVKADTDNATDSSVYASTVSDGSSGLHIILINKNWDESMNANVAIQSPSEYTGGQVWSFDSTGSTITRKSDITSITGNVFTMTLSKLSVTHIILTADTAPTPSPEPSAKGDVNEDGNTDIIDALLIGQYYVGLDPAAFTAPLETGDANCDNSVDIVDSLLIAQLYVGLITELC